MARLGRTLAWWGIGASLAVALGAAAAVWLVDDVELVEVLPPGAEVADPVPRSAAGSRARPARESCPAVWEDDYFWAAGTFGDDDSFVREWYSSHLRAMKEPSLSCAAPARGESYRFVWLRSFHRPVAVRVTLAGPTGHLTAFELGGKGGYAPGFVVRQFDRPLTTSEATAIRDDVVASGFWGMVSREAPSGCDGAQWIFEAQVDGAYHVVDRWSPEEGRLRTLCVRLLEMALVPREHLY